MAWHVRLNSIQDIILHTICTVSWLYRYKNSTTLSDATTIPRHQGTATKKFRKWVCHYYTGIAWISIEGGLDHVTCWGDTYWANHWFSYPKPDCCTRTVLSSLRDGHSILFSRKQIKRWKSHRQLFSPCWGSSVWRTDGCVGMNGYLRMYMWFQQRQIGRLYSLWTGAQQEWISCLWLFIFCLGWLGKWSLVPALSLEQCDRPPGC